MSDDLVKRARDCANGIGDMKTGRGDFGIFDDLADRIEELTEESARRLALIRIEGVARVDQCERAEALEAKPVKAVEALEESVREFDCPIARTTLAEIKGEQP